MTVLDGIGNIAAALTPFHADGSVDLAALDRQLAFIAAEPPLAVSVVAVEVQDYHVLSQDDRVSFVRHARERVEQPLIAGVSSPFLATSCRLAERMAGAGADAVLAVAGQKPWGAPPTPAEAVRWFHGLADACPVPVVLYNNPRTGVDLPVAVMRDICAHPNVVAIKETSRNVAKTLELCKGIDRAGHAAVFTNMESLVATLAAGGRGAMLPPPGLAAANALIRAFDAGDLDRARDLQEVFAEFPGRWMRLGLGPVMKAAMQVLGCPVGEPLPPYDGLTDDERRELSSFLTTSALTAPPSRTA